MTAADKDTIQRFIDRWAGSRGMERAVYQQFFVELCGLLDVEPPDPGVEKVPDYCFEKRVDITHPDGRTTARRVDLYKKGCFIIEAKQGSEAGDVAIGTARRGTESWKRAMQAAFGQALQYAAYLPEGKPPFLITCDIGHVFEVWTGFDGDYGGFGARRTIKLDALVDPDVFDYFRKIFTAPETLDPALHAAKVTREVAERLAKLARTLEADDRDPEQVAQFLMRCLFTMFAEDVGLLPRDIFTIALRDRWVPEPQSFQFGIEQLWKAMDQGLPFGFEDKLLRFNGNLFAFNSSLPLNKEQLQMLLEAAERDWTHVEPSIFGTLLERALSPKERHSLGAHFTPRAYIERLVRPTIIEPIREEWEIVQGHVRQTLGDGNTTKEPTKAQRTKAAKAIHAFHKKLCETRVLDPACGSGNFLYVTLDLFKRIEAEIIKELEDLGESQSALELEGFMVNPGQFLGIDINPRAREIADLVLWIGYLQWYRRTHGTVQPPEPILRQYDNIECRDALLTYDREELVRDKDGKPVTRWDGTSTKKHPVTGEDIPDDSDRAQVPVFKYINPRQAQWPDADYIVGNPPFIGPSRMRSVLGDGYVEALRITNSKVPDSADYVMHWWDRAAELIRSGKLNQFGLITTNSLRQTFARRVLQRHMAAKKSLSLIFAVPDHPWVDSVEGADVRIAMTVAKSGNHDGVLHHVTAETTDSGGVVQVDLSVERGNIHSDLRIGANVASATALLSNDNISNRGFELGGAGFIVNSDEARRLGIEQDPIMKTIIRSYRNGRDISQRPRGVMVIDLFGYDESGVRSQFPKIYQWLFEHVKPERASNRSRTLRENWWLHRRLRADLRDMCREAPRFAANRPENSTRA